MTSNIAKHIKTLEKLSLVSCSDEVLKLLERSLKNIEPILKVDTEGIRPLLWQSELSLERLQPDQPKEFYQRTTLINDKESQTIRIMLTAMLKEHQQAQDELKAQINNKRALAERAVENLTANNVRTLNEDVSRAYMNQHRLDSETRKLKTNVNKLTKQAQQWMVICNSLNSAVKDLGDINTWTKTIENDIQFISNAIGESYKPRDEQ